MAAKKRKGKIDVGQDLTEKTATVLLEDGECLPKTRMLLATKPHLSHDKREAIKESLKELRKFVKALAEKIFHYDAQDQEKYYRLLFAIITFLKSLLDFEDYTYSNDFRAIINAAVFFICKHESNTVDPKLKNHVALLSMRFLEMVEYEENEWHIASVTLAYLLGITTGTNENEKSARKIDMKHVWSMHKFLDNIDLFAPESQGLVEMLMSTVTDQNYIKCKEGHNVVGHLMSRNVPFAKRVHQMILLNAPKLNKQLASHYGEIYFNAWSMAKDAEVKEEIENCIQNLISKVVKCNRTGLEMTKAGANGLAILVALNQLRRFKKFSDVLNNLYTPILWRALRSSDPWERCNAAQIFLNVFPLEKPFLSEPDNALYMDRQIREIKDLLVDDSHFVRIVAIKGVCAQLTNNLELFSVTHIQSLMKILIEKLANDGSTYLVRKTVFEGFEMMINGPPDLPEGGKCEVALALEPLLDLIYLSIHDENEKVRKAFVKMLLKIKEKSANLTLRYWDLVPLKHLVVRLSKEGPAVGELIVKLIMDEFYFEGQDTDKMINRLLRLMSWNLSAITKLFHYSKSVLTLHQAFMIIITLVGMIRRKLKDYLDNQSEMNNENKKGETIRKNKRKGSLEDISNKIMDKDKLSEGETSSSSSSPPSRTPEDRNAEFLENHVYIAGLINGASVLWVAFRNELGENQEYLDRLYSLACLAVPLFLKHYKGTSVYYATVSFASLVPISKLRGVSTVSSACISELKEITEETEVSKIQCLIYALCSWSRGHDVLDLASEWLNYAFREQNLNNSAIPVKAGYRTAKVRFVPTEGKPMLSLKLLDILFSDVLNESRLISKNYEQLYEFYVCLERVVLIIERKVAGKEYFKPDTLLTDEFLSKAYQRYLRFMHTLHRLEPPPDATDSVPPFNATVTTLQAINWASNTLYKYISTEGQSQPNLAANCCLSVLKEATIAVALGYTDQTHCKSVALFASDLLSFDCVWFLEEVLNTIKVLSDYAYHETPDDEWLLLRNILPCLLEKSLNIMSNLDISISSAKECFKDLSAMKNALFAFPKNVLSFYGPKDPLFIDTLRMYISACIQMVMQEICKEDELIVCKTFDEQPYFVALILKYIILTPKLMKHILPTLLYYMNMYKEEGYKLLSSLSLILTVIYAAKARFDGVELETVVQDAYQICKNYKDKEKSKKVDLEESTFASTSSINIDVRKVGVGNLEVIAKFLNCSLLRPLPDPQAPNVSSTPAIGAATASSCAPSRADSLPKPESTPSCDARATSPPKTVSATPTESSSTANSVFLVPEIPVSSTQSINRSNASSKSSSTPASKNSNTPTSRPTVKRAVRSKQSKQTPSTPSPTSLSDSVSTPASESVFTPSPQPTNQRAKPSSSSKSRIKTKALIEADSIPQSALRRRIPEVGSKGSSAGS